MPMPDDKNKTNGGGDGSVGGSVGASPASSVAKSPLLVRTISMGLSNDPSPEAPPHSLVGIILIMIGSFSFSCMFLFVKLLEGKANSFTVSFYRALVEIPVAVLLCERGGIDDYIGPRSARLWLLVRGSTGGIAVLCFFYAIQHLSLPDAVTLQFTTPPFAAAFAVLFAGEKWMLLDMIGAVVCLLGVALIAHPAWLFGDDGSDTGNGDTGAGVAVALLGAAFAGMAYMSVRKVGHGASANIMVLYYSCSSLPMILIGSKLITGDWNVWGGGGNLSVLEWCWMLLTGLTAYAGQYLTNLGLQYESAATGTLATCSQIVFTYIFELTFLHEAINIWSIAGTLLIVGFMGIVGVFKMKSQDGTIHEVVAGEPEELALLFSAEHHIRECDESNGDNTQADDHTNESTRLLKKENSA